MFADFEWAVQLNRFSLNIVGLWPVANPRRKLISDLQVFSMIIVFVCICTVPSLLSLVNVWGDMTAMVDNMLYTLPFIMIPLKMLILWWKRDTLSPLLTMIAHDWINVKSSDERDIMIRRAQNARFIITCSYIILFLSMMIMVAAASLGYTLKYEENITDMSRPLPIYAYRVYNASASPQYEITFFTQCIVIATAALSYTGINNFIGLLVFHICGQLENLANRLYRMRESDCFLAALRINVNDHIRIIRSVTIVENSFTLMLLVIFFFFLSLFCIYGFLVVTVIVEENNVPIKRACFLIMIVCTVFIHMCIYCAVGELLAIKYEMVYNAVYEYEWYTLEAQQAKNLILMMIYANKPLCITAGKMFPITMSTFCNILKTSGGYISVLLAKRN